MSGSASGSQLPLAGQIFLDHVGWMVPDLEAAAAAIGRLGLPLTPYSEHRTRYARTGRSQQAGTANRLAMLPQGYLEILAAVTGVDTAASRQLRTAIRRHVGVHLVAFSVADAADEARLLAQRGIDLQPTVNLRRTVEAEDRSEAEVAFTVVRAERGQFPEAHTQILTHHTPQHMWQSRYLPAESAIRGLVAVAFVVDEPAAAAARYARFLDRPVSAGSEPTITLDRGRLRFMTRAGAAQSFGAGRLPPNPSIGAITLSSRDLARTRNVLLTNGLHPGSLGLDHLLIDATEAMGVHVIIEAV